MGDLGAILGVTFGPSWSHLGPILASLGPPWGLLGLSSGNLGAIWPRSFQWHTSLEPAWALWALSWALSGPSWAHLGTLREPRTLQKPRFSIGFGAFPLFAPLRFTLPHLELRDAVLAPSWVILGPVGAIFGPSCSALGPILASLRPPWGLLGVSFGNLGPIWPRSFE